MFQSNSNNVAVGSSLSCEMGKHLQSYAIAVDQRVIGLLMSTWRCPNGQETRTMWIAETEVVNVFHGSVYFQLGFISFLKL